MNFFGKLKNLFLNAIWPLFCCHCRRPIQPDDHGLCSDCFVSMGINRNLFCAVCKARLPKYEKICHRETHYLLAAATNYDQAVVKNLIWNIKYHKRKIAAIRAAKIINNYLNVIDLVNVLGEQTIVVPIPLHHKRERERGFNQSHEIAEQLHKIGSRNWPIVTALSRVINTQPQVEIEGLRERQKNIAGAFVFNQQHQNTIAGKNIILIDDVHTSGATMSEAVKVLRQAGAKKIIALVVAKA